MLSKFVTAFPPKGKHLLILGLQSLSTVLLQARKIKSAPVSTFSPSIYHKVMGPDAMIVGLWMLSFKQTFSLSSFTLTKRLFSSTRFLPFSSIQLSCSVVPDSLQPHRLQHTRPPYPLPVPGVYSDSCPLSQWCHPAISSSVALSSPSPPAFNLSQNQGLFKWVSSSHQVTKVLEFQLQHHSFQWIFRTDLL